LLNAAFMFYAIVRFIGLKESMEDLRITLSGKMPNFRLAFLTLLFLK